MNTRHQQNLPGFVRATLWIAMAFLACLPAKGGDPAVPTTGAPVRFGFTKAMFVELNPADTRVAVKSYANLLVSNNNLTVDDSTGTIDGPEAVSEAFVRGTLDIASLTTPEYLALPKGSTYPRMISASIGGSFAEKYVLLVRKDSGLHDIASLKGKRLLICNSLRCTLAPLWLDTLLASGGHEPAGQFFANVTSVTKPSRTLLPVFFHQADACIITQNSYAATCEMNPQIVQEMKVLATSPELVPTVTCIRAGLSPETMETILNAVVSAQYTASGKQVLTFFQCDRISEIEDKQIDNVRKLLATRTRLRNEDDPSTNDLHPTSANPLTR